MCAKFLILSALGSSLVACGAFDPNHFDSSLKPKQMTGFAKEISVGGSTLRIPYTPAGEIDEFLKLKEEAAEDSGEFAQLATDVTVSVSKVAGNKTRIKTSINLDGWKSNLNFDEVIAENDLTKENKISDIKHGPRTYEKSTWCKTAACDVVSTVITREDGEKMAFVYSYKIAALQFQLAQGSRMDNSDDKDAIEKLMRASQAGKQSVAIVNGISFAQIDIVNPDNERQYLVTLRTQLLSPENGMLKINRVSRPLLRLKRATKLEVALAGNDPDTGSIWIDFTFNPNKRVSKVGVLMIVSVASGDASALPNSSRLSPTTAIEIIERIIEPIQNFGSPQPQNITGVMAPYAGNQPRGHSNPVVPVYVLDISTPRTNKFTREIEAYREHPDVQRYIRAFTGEEPFKRCGSSSNHPTYKRSKAVYMIQTLSQYGRLLGGAANLVDGLPHAAYFTPLESEYLHSNDPNIVTQQTHTSDAAGPKQILTDIAINLLRIYREPLARITAAYGIQFKVDYTTPLEREYAAKHPHLRGNRSGIAKKIREEIYDTKVVPKPSWAPRRRPGQAWNLIKAYYNSIGGLKARKMIPGDSRNNFTTSMILSSLLNRSDFATVRNPTLLGLAYFQGSSVARDAAINTFNSKSSCTDESCELLKSTTSNYNVTLMQADKMNVGKCEHRLYAKSFLALQFIGSNPSKYGFGNVRRKSQNIYSVPGVLPYNTPIQVFLGNGAMM